MIWSLSVPCDKSDRRRARNKRETGGDGGGGGEQEIEGITISIFGLDRGREGGRETSSGEQRGRRPMIDIELIRIVRGGRREEGGLQRFENQ